MKHLFTIVTFALSFSGFCQDTIQTGGYVYGNEIQLILQHCQLLADRSGVIVIKDSNNTIRMQVSIVNDSLHGHYRTYYPNGVLMDDEYYLYGQQQGISNYYHLNGNLSASEVYIAGTSMGGITYSENGVKDLFPKQSRSYAIYPGGKAAMYELINKHLKYPPEAMENMIGGKVILKFEINESGKIGRIEVVRGIYECPECSAEAVRLMKLLDNWEPALIHNRPATSYYQLPLTFTVH